MWQGVCSVSLGGGQEVSVSRSCHASRWTTVDVVFGEDENDDESQDKKKLSGACNLVFKYSNELANTHDILSALEVLQKSKFNTKVVPTTDFDLLRSTMGELLSDETTEEDEKEILIEGERIVGNLSRSRAGATPQMEDVPFDAPPMKVARLW
jgi:hypothetical protein